MPACASRLDGNNRATEVKAACSIGTPWETLISDKHVLIPKDEIAVI